jgi:hypothetical protein
MELSMHDGTDKTNRGLTAKAGMSHLACGLGPEARPFFASRVSTSGPARFRNLGGDPRAHRIRPALGSFQHLKPFLVV